MLGRINLLSRVKSIDGPIISLKESKFIIVQLTRKNLDTVSISPLLRSMPLIMDILIVKHKTLENDIDLYIKEKILKVNSKNYLSVALKELYFQKNLLLSTDAINTYFLFEIISEANIDGILELLKETNLQARLLLKDDIVSVLKDIWE